MNETINKYKLILIYLVLALVTIAAYEPIRLNDFVRYDDPVYIIENKHINNGITWQSFKWAFTSTHCSMWHPLTSLSHMLDCEFFGLNPPRHHQVNLLFHIANVLLLFSVLKMITGAVWRSGFVAAVFALHPLNVESVAWAAERKNVLSVFFWILTVAAYTVYCRRKNVRTYLLAVFVGCLALMSKPTAVALPLSLFALDYWPLNRFEWAKIRSLVAEKIPLFIFAAIIGIITFISQRSGGAMQLTEQLPLDSRIANALVSYVGYIGKIFYPTRLAVMYPHPMDGLSFWKVMACLIAIIAISIAALQLTRHRRYPLAGWLWYLVTLIPVIGIVQSGRQAMADRYTYLPAVGIFIIVTWGAAEFAGRKHWRKIVLTIFAGALLIVLLVCTRLQVKLWRNDFSLFKQALDVTENNYLMHNNFGNTLLRMGRLDEAIKHYDEARRIAPQSSYKSLYNKGKAFLNQGKVDKAIATFKEVLRADRHWYYTYNDLGMAYAQKGNLDLAMQNYDKALQIKSDYHETYYNMASTLTKLGRYDEAVEHLKKALHLRPNWPEAHYNLGAVYYRQGNLKLAVQQSAEAVRLKPNYLMARINMADALFKLGRTAASVEQYYKVLEFKDDRPDILNSLAWILAVTEDANVSNPEDAIKFAEKACEITDYNLPEILDTLAAAYASSGRFTDAIETTQKALKIALESDKKDMAGKIQSCLELYKSGRAYREPTSIQDNNEP